MIILNVISVYECIKKRKNCLRHAVQSKLTVISSENQRNIHHCFSDNGGYESADIHRPDIDGKGKKNSFLEQ